VPVVTIDELTLADEPAHWSALGFTVVGDTCQLGAVRLRFAGTLAATGGPDASGIIGWSLRELASTELDGLATTISRRPAPPPAQPHANGALAIDHIVAASSDLDRSIGVLQAAGLDLRRVREQPTPAGAPRQAFFRLGAEILELIQEPERVIASSPAGEHAGGRGRGARFWGLAVLVGDIERAVASLGEHVGEARAAVQPGRRIATVRRSAGLAVPLALMSVKQHAEV
jgi:hypothetical protein